MSETILVVDDEANIRDLAKLYLEKEGYTVETATNGQEALDMVRYTNPDLMVLDLMMPEVDGYEVCRRIRGSNASYQSLPIVMLTARDDDIDQIIGLELGADDYMTKPFKPACACCAGQSGAAACQLPSLTIAATSLVSWAMY